MALAKMKCRNIIIMVALALLVVTGYLYATTYKYLYPGDSTYLATDLYSGATPDLASDGAYDWGADIDLETDGYYGIWVTLEHDSSGNTDDIVIAYASSYDGTNYDDVYLFEIQCDDSSSADLQQSFAVFPAPPHGKLGVKSTNVAADTFDFKITIHKVRGDGT